MPIIDLTNNELEDFLKFVNNPKPTIEENEKDFSSVKQKLLKVRKKPTKLDTI